MSGLTAFLQAELLTLSGEARRKHPDIKEAAERLSAILRSFKERPNYTIDIELAKNEDALRPFTLACETKQVKLVTIAIGCIHKLISAHAIPETSVRTILRTLNEISVHGVDIQLKILQTVLPLLNNYHTVHDDILAEALLICFHLQDSKIAIVNNMAAVTLKQLVIAVFDKVSKEDSTELNEVEAKHEIQLNADESISLRPCAKDAYYLFQDLCLLTNNEQAEYLKLGHLSKIFGLELIESVLTNHYALFESHKELTLLLRGRVCPLTIKSFSEKHGFSQTMRVTRVVSSLIKKFSEILVTECEIFFSMLVKILEPENPLWLRVLVMEVFRGVCMDPSLVSSIYKWYDRPDGSTNVFCDMITGFGRLATEKPQLLGASHGGRDSIDIGTNTSGHASYLSMTNSSAANDNSSAGLSVSGSTMRIQCIDQLDKTEAPVIPETYLFYLSLLCLNAIADGLKAIVPIRVTTESDREPNSTNSRDTKEDDLALVSDMAEVAWPGLLAAMSFYLSSNLDEELFQSTMKSYENFTNVCGMLNLVTPRDAFLTNLCKNAIPLISILSSSFFFKNSSTTSVTTISTTPSTAISYQDLPVQQQQLLASITLSDKNLHSLRVLLKISMRLDRLLGSSWYLVLDTLQQADFLLFNRPSPKGAANAAGAGSGAPHLRRTLTGTIRSPVSPGASQAQSAGALSPSLQPLELDQVTDIKASLDRLFENSKDLDDAAFIGLATSLCRLSAEASGVPFDDGEDASASKSSRAKLFNNRSFAIEKLRDIAMQNMHRLMDPEKPSGTWDLIMRHLIANANYPQTLSLIRAQCCDTISEIVLTAMKHVLSEYKETDENMHTRLLTTLSQCIHPPPNSDKVTSSDSDKVNKIKTCPEVQHMALETLNNLLQTSGHSFTCGWGLIFNMLRHVIASTPSMQFESTLDDDTEADKDKEGRERTSMDTIPSPIAQYSHKTASSLIKITFSSLQLICTDFLSHLSPDCLRQCIATLGDFGAQSEDLNISLTAVGLLWSLSDFIRTKRAELTNKNMVDDGPIEKENMNIERTIESEQTPKVLSVLWMLLLLQLSHTCTDWRPEVRNGANQTLFRTIMMNGPDLDSHLWSTCIWEVLFPLIDAIKMSSIRAARTALSGKSNVTSPVASERETSGFMLHHSRDTTDKQWDETKVLVLTGVSVIFRDFRNKLHSLPNFTQAWELFLSHLEDSTLRSSQEVSLASVKSFKNIVTLPQDFTVDDSITKFWCTAWSSWKCIGSGMMASDGDDLDKARTLHQELQPLATSLSSPRRPPIAQDFTQDTLTAFVAIFADLYRVISSCFSLEDMKNLLSVLRNVLVYSTSPQYRPDVDHLSPLQEAVLNVIQALDTTDPGMPPLILMDLSEYMTLAFLSPQDDEQQKSNGHIPLHQRKFSTVTYIALNKKCNMMIAEMFEMYKDNIVLYTEGVFERIIGSYGLPMKLKYDCPPSFKHGDDRTPLWKMATKGLVDVLRLGLRRLQDYGTDVPTERFEGVWKALVVIFKDSLLSPSAPPANMAVEDQDADEQFDIWVLKIIEQDVVIYMGEPRVPDLVITELINVIRDSSRLYNIDEGNSQRKTSEARDRQTSGGEGDKDTDGIAGSTGTIVPALKESFAYDALKTLFTLCSSEKQDPGDVPKRVAQATIPVLLERCETVLQNYTVDEPLLGRCPFPRVRKEEMLFILRQSIQLELQKDILTVDKEKGTVRSLLLTGPRAHLFYLYPTLCNMIKCEDSVVVSLIQECLQVAGIEIGLYSASSSR